MKNSKWIWLTLTILLTLVVLVGVGGAGFRMGLMQSVNNARNIGGTPPTFGNMYNFDDEFNKQTRNPHMQMQGFDRARGFEHGWGRGRFSPLLGLVHIAVLGLLLWAGYKLYKKSGWQFVKVNASETAPLDEKKE